nr:MAG TPA: hypothetical protein [Caudoviricetes sp.]
MTRCSRACIKESADQECDADSLTSEMLGKDMTQSLLPSGYKRGVTFCIQTI